MVRNRRRSQTRTPQDETPQRASLPPYWVWVALALVLAFTAAVRLRLLDFPLERDEGEYAYMGQLMLQGVPPYESAYNMKFPGTYAAYATILGVFGQTVAGIHLGILLLNAGAIVLVFLIGRRLFDGAAGVMAAASYALLTMSQGSLGLAGHATHFVILPALGAVLLMLKLREDPRAWRSFDIGLLLGIAVLMKQPGALFVVMVWLYILWIYFRRQPRRLSPLLASTGLFAAGVAIPLLVAGLALWRAGVFGKFWYWTIVYARAYGALVPLRYVPQIFAESFAIVVLHTWPIWLLAGMGLSILFLRQNTRPLAWFMTFFLGFSFAAVCPGFYFRQHYFILMMPAVALALGAGISSMCEVMKQSAGRDAALVPLLLFGGACGGFLWQEGDYLFRLSPEMACRQTYAPNPFVEAKEVASYIASHTDKGDAIAVMGSEPEIYFYANRRSATGYIYMYPLMEPHGNARAMQEEMIRQIEAVKPKYMVKVNVQVSWLINPYSDKHLIEWYREYEKGYDVVGIVDLMPDGATYRWDAAALGQKPRGDYSLVVLRRK